MTMAQTYTYRPKLFKVTDLLKIAKQHHTNLNRFIEDALAEKLLREKDGKAQVLADKVTKVVVEHMGLKLTKPDVKTAAKIKKDIAKAKKTGRWISDRELRPYAYKGK